MSGWADLGSVLGGSGQATYEKAFQEGRFRSAQTEEALQTARVKQQEAIQREARNKHTTELLANPAGLSNPDDAMMALIMAAEMGGQYKDLSTGMGDQQSIRFRDRVANVDTNNESRLRALQAIEGKPSADVQAIGADDFVDLASDLQVPQILDSEQKRIAAGTDGTPQWQNYQNLVKLGGAPGPDTFSNILRGPQVVNATNPSVVLPSIGAGPGAAPKPIIGAGEAAGNAGLKAQGVAEGTARGQQTAATGGKIDKAETMLTNIDQLLGDPAFDTIYGLSNVLDPRNYIPGTDAARAGSLLKTIDAETFGLAIEQMKGLGALSNAEGQKVQAAFTEATNPNLDEVDARAAWAKVQTRMKKAVDKARTLQSSAILPQPGAGGAPTDGPPPGFELMEDAQGNRAYVNRQTNEVRPL